MTYERGRAISREISRRKGAKETDLGREMDKVQWDLAMCDERSDTEERRARLRAHVRFYRKIHSFCVCPSSNFSGRVDVRPTFSRSFPSLILGDVIPFADRRV